MEHKIDTFWNKLEDARRDFLTLIEDWSTEQLEFHEEGSWSALHVMEHLIGSETGTFGYMKKKTSSGWESIPLTTDEQVSASSALNQRLISIDRFKAPAVLKDPAGEKSRDVMMYEWQTLRDDARIFVYSLDEAYHDRLIFKQPIAGPLNLFHTLEFLTNHIRHHIYQLERIRVAQGM